MSVDDWRAIYQSFDPMRPALDPAERQERAYSPIPEISRVLRKDLGIVRALVMGSIGTGKTSELMRLLDEQGSRRRVVYIDIADHFHRQGRPSALEDVQPWELMVFVGVAALRAAEHYGVYDQGERAAFEAALTPLVATTESKPPPVADLVGAIGEVMAVVAPTAGAVVQKLGSTVSWALPLGRRTDIVPDDDPKVQSLLHATNRALLALGRVGAPPLLVVDGLDRLDQFDPAAMERIFLRSSALASFECHTVACGPIGLRRGQRLLEVRGLSPYLIAEVPVVDRADRRRPNPQGLAFFRGLWERRTGARKGAIPQDLVDVLAFNSAGRVREFMKLVRDVCAQSDADVATAADVEAVLRSYRYHVVEAGLTEGMVRVLREVLDTGTLPDDDLVDPLIRGMLIVAYPNNEEWFSPPPIPLRGRLAG